MSSFFSTIYQEHSKSCKNTFFFAHKAQTRVRVSKEGVGEVEAENGMCLGKLRSLNRVETMKIGFRQ